MSQPLARYRPATTNANRHTERGLRALEASIRQDGYVAPITVAADGEALDGSARLEVAADVLDTAPLVVEHDGTRPVIMVRTDIPTAATEMARRIAVRANRIAQIDLDWDPAALLQMPEETIKALWTEAELSDLGQQWNKSQEEQPRLPVAMIERYMIIITCESESQQVELLERFMEEGLTCRALVS